MRLLQIALLAAPIALLASFCTVVETVHAGECRDASSYIQMPNERCYDLNYLTILSKSRAGLKNAAELYNEAARINNSTGLSTSFTRTVGDRDEAFSTTRTVRDDPTAEERLERRQLLRDTSKTLDTATAQNDVIERWGFQQHLQVLNEIDGGLAP